jgi:hypothetical protein
MSQAVLDAIALETARLERIVPLPTGNLGYGTDLRCITDVTPDLAEVDPARPMAIGEALLRRLITPRGGLLEDRNYGFDVRGYCNRGVPQDELRDLGGLIRAECMKDDRVEDLTISILQLGPNSLSIQLRVVPADPELESFALTFAVINGELTMEAFG